MLFSFKKVVTITPKIMFGQIPRHSCSTVSFKLTHKISHHIIALFSKPDNLHWTNINTFQILFGCDFLSIKISFMYTKMIPALNTQYMTLGSTEPQQIQKLSPKHQLRNRILNQSAKHLDSNMNFGTKRF